jgi:hypothetical protein
MKLVKTVEYSGSNGRVFRHTDQVCRAQIKGIDSQSDGERDIELIINDGDLKFDTLRFAK